MAAAVAVDPGLKLTVDLTALELRYGAGVIRLTMRESARDALVHGRWDAIAELLEGMPAVKATTARLPYLRLQV